MAHGKRLLVSAALVLVFAAPAAAAPATTVQHPIFDCDGDNLLEFTSGEEHLPFGEASQREEGSRRRGCSAVG